MSQRSGVMLAKPLTERLLAKLPDWVIVQAKLDGDRCRAVPYPNTYSLYSSQETNRDFAVPHIPLCLVAAARHLWPSEDLWEAFDGELYVHGWSHQQIRSVVSRTANTSPDFYKIQYHVFDIISTHAQLQRAARLMELHRYVEQSGPRFPIRVVPTRKVPNTPESITEAMSYFLRAGYEGVIVRDPYAYYETKRSDGLLKLKPTERAVGQCVEMLEAISLEGEKKEMLGAFVVVCQLEGDQKVFKVGAGKLTHHQRRQLWKMRSEHKSITVHFRYLTLTDDGLPREPICTHVEVS